MLNDAAPDSVYLACGPPTLGSAVSVAIDPLSPEVRPFVSTSGRTMLPLRFIAENPGATVEWFEATQTIAITAGE